MSNPEGSMKEAEYIQFSWFSNEFVNQDIEQIYQGLVGVEAENSWKSKNITPANPFLYQSSGNNGDLNYLVRISPERLDFVVRVAQLGDFRSIDPIPDVTSKLDDLIEKISAYGLCDINSVNRLALITNLCKFSDNVKSANESFLEICPLKLVASDISDLFFKINKRKKIINSLLINRLISCNFEHYKHDIKGMNNCLYVLNVLLDYNTVPDGALEIGRHKEIWNGLFGEIRKFIENPNVEKME